MKKHALICGVSGQDGAYLSKLLLSKGYFVSGTSRDAHGSSFSKLKKLGIYDKLSLYSMDPEDFRSVLVILKELLVDEIYFLGGQSSVGLSFEQPSETLKSILLGTLNILEAARMIDKSPKIYFAGSSECFGDTGRKPASEQTPFNPKSPYAVAKASAYWLVQNYREAYGIFACTGILFNHESPIRPERFVTQKIISAAKRLAQGSSEILQLGRLDILRDWGWAPEYVEAMWLMLQQEQAEDYVIATGESNQLKKFVEITFLQFGLNWEDHVTLCSEFVRPSDIVTSSGDASKAFKELGWSAKYRMLDVIKLMISGENG